VLDELLDYVAEHFQHEEELMRLSGYPDIEAHIAQHVALTNSVASVVTSTPLWTPENINKLRQFANKWLVGHILGTDLKFARWYRENKVEVYMDETGHFQKVKVSFWQRLMGKK
jgi:hemerythrin-like metal-binding protein